MQTKIDKYNFDWIKFKAKTGQVDSIFLKEKIILIKFESMICQLLIQMNN